MRKRLPKISYIAAILLAGAVSWQCNDDKVWDEPAIGSVGDTEYSFTSSGGTKTITFNTTVGWTASVNYVNGGGEQSWCTISPTSGPAGQGEVTVTINPTEAYENQVAEVIINAGGAVKTYTFTQHYKYVLEADSLTYTGLSFEENVIAVPVLSNIEYTINYDPSDAADWITPVESKAAPVQDTLYFQIATYQSGLLPREANIVLANSSLGYKQTILVSQEPGPTLTVNPLVSQIDGKAQTVTAELLCSMDWTITPKETYDWCTLDITSGERGDQTLTFECEEAITQARQAIFIAQADTMIREIVINQTEQGVENGSYIFKGNITENATPTMVNTGDELYAFYTYPLSVSGQANVYSGTVYSDADWTQNEPIYIHLNLLAPANSVKLSISTNSWEGNNMRFQVYAWNQDVETSLKGSPIIDNIIEHEASVHKEFLEKGQVVPGGVDLLVVMKGTVDDTFGYWSWNAVNKDVIKGIWSGSKEIADRIPELYFVYNTDVKKNMPQVAYRMSEDNGASWSNQTACATAVNGILLTYNVSPKNIKIQSADGDYYATFDMGDNKVYIAKATNVDSEWKLWNGSSWAAWYETSTIAPIMESETPVSLVINNGTAYVYYMDGPALKVATASAGENWPANLSSASTAYEFEVANASESDEETWSYPAEIDVKVHANGEFIATYVNDVRSIGTLSSNNGTNFTLGESLAPLETYYMWAGAKGISYSVDESTGTVPSGAYMIYAITEGTQGLYAFPTK